MASRCVLIHQLLLGHEIGLNLGLQLVKQRDDLLDGAHFGVQSGRVHHGSQDQGADQHREIKTRVLEPRVRVRKNGRSGPQEWGASKEPTSKWECRPTLRACPALSSNPAGRVLSGLALR